MKSESEFKSAYKPASSRSPVCGCVHSGREDEQRPLSILWRTDGEAAACCENLGLAKIRRPLAWPIVEQGRGGTMALPYPHPCQSRGEAGLGPPPLRVRPWRLSCSFLSGIRLSAVSVPLSGTKFAGPLVALHLPLSLSRALLSFSLTGRGLFTALFISLSVGNAQAELPLGRQVAARVGRSSHSLHLFE